MVNFKKNGLEVLKWTLTVLLQGGQLAQNQKQSHYLKNNQGTKAKESCFSGKTEGLGEREKDRSNREANRKYSRGQPMNEA